MTDYDAQDRALALARCRAVLRAHPARRELVELSHENLQLRSEVERQRAPRTAAAGESDAGRGVSPQIDTTPSVPILDGLAEFVEQLHAAQITEIKRRNRAY